MKYADADISGSILVYLKENAPPTISPATNVTGRMPVQSCMINFARSISTALTGKVRYSCIFLFMNISFTIRLTVIKDNMMMISMEIINIMEDSIFSSASTRKLNAVISITGRKNNANKAMITRDAIVRVRIFRSEEHTSELQSRGH